jgi:hypothetical protein
MIFSQQEANSQQQGATHDRQPQAQQLQVLQAQHQTQPQAQQQALAQQQMQHLAQQQQTQKAGTPERRIGVPRAASFVRGGARPPPLAHLR